MKDVAFLAGILFGIIFCFLMVSLGVVDHVDNVPGTEQEPALALPTYLSFISVMLTSVTVVLAAVAIGIGVVAFYTIREIKYAAQKTAGVEATKVAADALSQVKVQQMVFELYANAEKQRKEEEEWGTVPQNEE